MTWKEAIKYYFPNAEDDECDFILWEKTCFPFDREYTLDDLYRYYLTVNKET